MRHWVVLVAGLVAGCTAAPVPEVPAPPAAQGIAPPPPVAQPAAADLFGEWQVAALDSLLLSAREREVGDPTRIAILIGQGTIDAASQCVPYLFEYTRHEARINIAELRWPGPICARGLLPFEQHFDAILAGATRIEALPGGRVRLSGDTGSVTLRRPDGGFLDNPFGNMPSPGPELFWGHFRVLEVGGVRPSADAPIDFAVGHSRIEARSGCVPFRWRHTPSNRSLTLTPEQWPQGVCERGRSAAEQALERIMPAVRSFTWVGPYRVRLDGPAGAVTLERVREAAD